MGTRFRSLAAVALLAAATVLGPAAAPARAHGSTITIVVAGDGGGRVRAAATWTDDHHRVRVPVAAYLTATSQQAGPAVRIGPAAMTAVPGDTGIYESATPQPSGRWEVSVQSASPALGYGHAALAVGAATGFPANFPPAEPVPPVSPLRAWVPWAGGTFLLAALGLLALSVRAHRTRARTPAR